MFQNRYKSIVCQEDVYLKELVRYIHLNLLRAGLVKGLKELSRNSWSGHSALVGKVERKWQNTEHVLSFFGGNGNSGKNYSRYVENGIDQGRRPELVGGERAAADQRIFGNGDFARQLGYSGADVARYLGGTNSCVTRMISSGKKPEKAFGEWL